MNSRQAAMKTQNLINKRDRIQLNVNKKKDAVAGLEEDISRFMEQIDRISSDIDRLSDDTQEEVPVEEMEEEAGAVASSVSPVAGDGATSTASLDASSTSTGGDYGGWRHYKKVGEVQKRKKSKSKEYISTFWDDDTHRPVDDGGN